MIGEGILKSLITPPKQSPLTEWNRGDRFSAAHLNETVNAIRELRISTGVGGAADAFTLRPHIGLLTDAGPNDEDNFTDERYWVKIQRAEPNTADTSGEIDAVVELADQKILVGTEFNVPASIIVCATNLAEARTHSHALRDGDDTGLAVIVWAMVDSDEESPRCRWVFNLTNVWGEIVTVKVTGNASGGGKYTGRILLPTESDVSASGDMGDSELGILPAADNALVLNLQERALSTHALTTGSHDVNHFIGRVERINSDGTYVVHINGIPPYDCEE